VFYLTDICGFASLKSWSFYLIGFKIAVTEKSSF